MGGIAFSCQCGAVQIDMPNGGAASGVHTLCFCRDCRAFARHLGQAEHLEPGGGLRVFITRPDRLRITTGAEHLRCLYLAPGGLERWYTACCNSPVSSHMSGWASMAGVTAYNAKEASALGPVTAVYCAASALPGANTLSKDSGINRLKLKVLGWSLSGLATGYQARDPFTKLRQSGAEPVVLDDATRAPLYA